MSATRALQGGCQCGRNRYVIAVPENGIRNCQVVFNTEPTHQIPLATLLPAYLRVPLSWYHSTTYAYFPDESHSAIRRAYTHHSQQESMRHFCGFCGTPLSYWSEHPSSEADYISLTLGSLDQEDLRDLDDTGLISHDGESESDEGIAAGVAATAPAQTSTVLRESQGVPWFESMVEGTRFGNMRRRQGVQRSRDGRVKMEWEIVEYTDEVDPGGEGEDVDMGVSTPGKRKLGDRDEMEAASAEKRT